MIETLISVVSPPHRKRGVALDVEWSDIRHRLGLPPHEHMVQINQTYGSGFFSDFVWVLSPAQCEKCYSLHDYTGPEPEDVANSIRKLAGDEDIDRYQFMPFAWTRGGDDILQVYDNNRPVDKLLVIGSRAHDEELVCMPPVEFLVALLSRSLESRIFPPTVVTAPPTFEPIAIELHCKNGT